MKTPVRRLLAAFAFGATMLSTGVGLGAFTSTAQAQGIFEQPKYAAIVVDAKTGEVLYARHADLQRYPASITKVMTLYMVFEALANGRLSPNERIVVSQHAANQAPSKLGLRAGESITVDEAIRAAAVKSANDMAVALGERVGGSEERFTQMMTARAHELGMVNTRFYNANGLPNPGGNNVTTARDLAILSRAVMRDYPQYYSYFSQREFAWRGHNTLNHNRLMLRMPGVDGIKTGYTAAAGFNLAASAVRDGRRLITVVLGGPSTAARDNNVQTLLTAGFDVLNRRARGQNITIAANLGVADDMGGGYAHPAVQPGEPHPVMVAEAPPAPRPAPALQQAPILALAAMSPVPNPAPTARAPLPEAAYKLAEAAKPKLLRASLARVEAEGDEDEDAVATCAAVPAKGRRHHHRRSAAKACTASVQVAKAETDPCAKLKKSRRRACEAKVEKADARIELAKAEASDDCGKVRKSRRKACELKAEKAEAKVQVAKIDAAEDHCARVKKSRRKACEATAEVQVAALSGKPGRLAKAEAAESGSYTIQVGAFDNRKQAHAQMEKVSERFAHFVASAAGEISHAAGNYRVRFTGFRSETAARTACHKISSKGERCMVVAEGLISAIVRVIRPPTAEDA